MLVKLRNPTRELSFDDGMTVARLLNRLGADQGSVLVISDGNLVPYDAFLPADAKVEVRSVISGGSR